MTVCHHFAKIRESYIPTYLLISHWLWYTSSSVGLGFWSSLLSYSPLVNVLALHTNFSSSSMRLCYHRILKKPPPTIALSYSFLNDNTPELNTDGRNRRWHLLLFSQNTNQLPSPWVLKMTLCQTLLFPLLCQIQSHSYSYPGPGVGADNPFSHDTLCFRGLDKIHLLGFFHHRNLSSASFASTFLVKSLNVGLYQDLSLCRTASHQMTAFRRVILNSIYMPNDNAYIAHFWSLPWNYR